MEKLKITEIAEFCKAEARLDGFVDKISIDSREIDDDTLFVAIKGERFDGNDFVPEVLNKGVRAVVCSRTDIDDRRIITVEDTGKALLDIAGGYRDKFNIPVVALTGSVGKTTTKGMVYSVLSEKFNTLKTAGNLNNEIGVPKTLFCLNNCHEAAVIEMGMNHKGEISRISAATKPTVGVITNVGTAHIENFGSRDGILKAKCEILDGMKKGSPLIINGDNDMLSTLSLDEYKVMRFGIEGEKLYMRATDIISSSEGMRFRAVCNDETCEVFVPVAGVHNVYNALCALCVGKALGFSLNDAANGIKSFKPEGMRQKITKVKGYTFIEDCYNANPDSMRASLKTLGEIKKTRAIAVLGDMLELGDYSKAAHFEIGEYAARVKTDAVFCFGDYSHYTAEAAKKAGVCEALYFDDKCKLTEYLKNYLREGDTVLFKGSRGVKTEEVFCSLYREWGI